MYLYFYQIEELLSIIDGNQLIVGTDFGIEFVTNDDIFVLRKFGIDFRRLLDNSAKSVFNAFNFGMLADSLKVAEELNFSFDQLKDFIKNGKYIPVPNRDKFINESLSNQPFKEMLNYPEYDLIRMEIIDGSRDKKSPQQIASNIGHKTGIWNLEDIIYYYQQIAWDEAWVKEVKKRNDGRECYVYRWASKTGCCEFCIRLYLTDGVGSQPIIFKLSELEKNGSNELRSLSEWKPTLFPTHKYCSFHLFEYTNGYLWNKETQSFSIPDPEYKRQIALKRKLIRVIINGKEHYL